MIAGDGCRERQTLSREAVTSWAWVVADVVSSNHSSASRSFRIGQLAITAQLSEGARDGMSGRGVAMGADGRRGAREGTREAA